MSEFKDYKCIVAGIFTPGSIGFESSGHNTYPHYSEIINSNIIAFTK